MEKQRMKTKSEMEIITQRVLKQKLAQLFLDKSGIGDNCIIKRKKNQQQCCDIDLKIEYQQKYLDKSGIRDN